MKKYLQLNIVTAAKQMTSAHAGPRMSAKVSGAVIEAEYHLDTGEVVRLDKAAQ